MNDKVKSLINDAMFLYWKAINEVNKGELRDACEKAWVATVKATSALILAITGKELDGSKGMSKELNEIARKDDEVRNNIIPRYYIRQDLLHGDCFYMGICEPKDEIERRIRETLRYIEDIIKLIQKNEEG